MELLTLLAIAFAPGVALSLYLYWKDEHEKEPIRLLLTSFFYGFISIIITLIISFLIQGLYTVRDDSIADQFVHAFFKVALVEEFSKFIFIRFILFRNKNFNEPFDGIIYTGMVGMGFATLENIFYVLDLGIETGIMRMFTAVPAHATFAILMGYFIGKGKFDQKNLGWFSFLALLSASLFHGAYDFFLFISFVPGMAFGAILSLIAGIVLSRKAIQLHQDVSPFAAERILLKRKDHPKKQDE